MRRFRRSKRAVRRAMPEDMIVQVTSLADVLMIVMVFLLKSFSSGINDVENVQIPNDIRIPEISESGTAKTGLTVEISRTAVKVAGKTVTLLDQYRFSAADLETGSPTTPGVSKALAAALSKVKDKARGPASATPAPTTGNLWIIADKAAPYQTVQTVMLSAAHIGFSAFKLAVTTVAEE